MPNYNAHTYFGMKVLEELPVEARRSCVEDLPVFRTALYGPDPLLFCSVKAKRRADYLHKTWREQNLSDLERSIRRLATAPLYIDETPALSVSEFSSKAKRLVMEKAVEIIFVDYLGLMTAPASNAAYREQVISEVSRQLKATAKELKIPVIAMAQLNRNIVGRLNSSMGRPQLSDLRDSGSIEQDADIVIFINRPGLMGKSEDPDDAELIIAKNRAGRLDDIDMRFIGDQVLFVEDKRPLSDIAREMAPSKTEKRGARQQSAPPYNPFDGFGNINPEEFR